MSKTKLIITNLQSYPTQGWHCYNNHEDRRLYWTDTPLTISLRKGKKALWEKEPIALKNVLDFYRQTSSKLQQKGNLVSLQVYTAHFGIGENSKQAGTYFGKKTAQKFDHIKNNPLALIINLLTI